MVEAYKTTEKIEKDQYEFFVKNRLIEIKCIIPVYKEQTLSF